MGQRHSTQPTTHEPSRRQSIMSIGHDASLTSDSTSIQRALTPSRARRKLKPIELHAVGCLFKELKTTEPDSLTCIETQKFLEHLQLPAELEPAGILLFKSFSYLGTYPDSAAVGPVPLTLEAFITAFAVLTGKMDQDGSNAIFEDCLFESLATLPVPTRPSSPSPSSPEVVALPEEPSEILKKSPTRHKRGLSLAELGVNFDDIDFEAETSAKKNPPDDEKSMDIMCSDLVDLMTLILWIADSQQQRVAHVNDAGTTAIPIRHTLAESLVISIPPTGKIGDKPCLSKQRFDQWKQRHVPRLFDALRSFIYTKFSVVSLISPGSNSGHPLIGQHPMPMPDESDILHGAHVALLSWRLPEQCLQVKEWPRLYSADRDGFAMNRFETHVFKYSGPTLLLMQVELAATPTHSTISKDTTSKEPQPSLMTLGAFIPESWKHTKQYWGNDTGFLFELLPFFEVCGSTRRNTQYMYCHDDFGIGLGGTSDRIQPPKSRAADFAFMLALDNTLQSGTYGQEAYPARSTFEKSERRPSEFLYTFDTVNIEVFGLGSEKDRLRQKKEWSFEESEALKRTGLQIRQQDGHVDKEILRMAGIIDDHHPQ